MKRVGSLGTGLRGAVLFHFHYEQVGCVCKRAVFAEFCPSCQVGTDRVTERLLVSWSATGKAQSANVFPG
jgi:hypothetical protein